jgi:TonB family protein
VSGREFICAIHGAHKKPTKGMVYCGMLRRLLLFTLALSTLNSVALQSNDAEKRYLVGNDVKAAHAVSTPQPHWSKASRKKHIQGDVGIYGYVGTDGGFHTLKVVRSLDPTIDADALEAVKKWKFLPCTKDGQPVNCIMTLQVIFSTP